MNSGNTKTPDPHRLLLNLSYQINWKKVINKDGKIQNSYTKTINLKKISSDMEWIVWITW